MNPIETHSGESAILYDADLLGQADAALFSVAAWQAHGGLRGSARGRGETAFVSDGARDYVLRHYRRGGLPGKLVQDRYLWTGLARTRAWREWHLTAELYRRGLPVPQPAAAQVLRRGLSYSADLLTVRIPAARSLAETLAAGPLPADAWRAVGACLRRFHDAGLDHADLNAHNILLNAAGVHLIDFDRGRLRAPGPWRQGNLARLRRSLDKLRAQSPASAFGDADWQALWAGYNVQSSSSAAA